MIINFSPVAGNKTTTASLDGLILTIDGKVYDLSGIPVGGEAEADLPFVGRVTREEVTIQYFYNSDLAELHQSPNLADYSFNVTEGEVPCPIKWRIADV